MRWRRHHIAATIALATYVLAGVIIDVSHQDIVALGGSGPTTISSHDCGATEIHLPLDHRHDCTACSQQTSRVATAAMYLPPDDATTVSFRFSPGGSRHILCPDVLHSGKRGPPLS